MGSSIPIKLLNEAQGHVVSVELNNGAGLKGKLSDSEDSMNVLLKDVTETSRDGSVKHLDEIFVRGSQIRFVSVPDILKNAPFLKKQLHE
ncbi:small nuclear ribonucleoprotein Sm D3 [Brettanomyces bruxellensis]|uniref:Small nuclear ribonucleoprotein Sm D3 n=1 Tax=Dekkera bruxellensis TaxID=5007 RepID=A0A871R7C6_DEKBR|nr:small nuclear ribonucleoprotein Sm D3 [Brettanomyces bruxellensis]QOU20614.1 small nuclear ribonucleoprotein Sm D3 [Brettanomyces bruxellensis]